MRSVGMDICTGHPQPAPAACPPQRGSQRGLLAPEGVVAELDVRESLGRGGVVVQEERLQQPPMSVSRVCTQCSHGHRVGRVNTPLTAHQRGCRISHWRDCRFADALSPSPLKRLLKVEGVAVE